MKMLLAFLLLFIPQIVFAETSVLRIMEVDGLKMVTASDIYQLGEECIIKNRDGQVLSLSDLKLPATARADIELVNDEKVLNRLVVIDERNNLKVPE
jgi:hypothetical protein